MFKPKDLWINLRTITNSDSNNMDLTPLPYKMINSTEKKLKEPLKSLTHLLIILVI